MNGINQTSTPCIKVCEYYSESNQICKGCGRTANEIGEWLTASQARKKEIIKAAKARRKKDS